MLDTFTMWPRPRAVIGERLPAELGGRDQVHPDHRAQLGGRHRAELAGVVDAGVVDEHVDGTARRPRPGRGAVERAGVAQIADERRGAIGPALGDDGVHRGTVARHERDGCARPADGGERAADPTAAPVTTTYASRSSTRSSLGD